MNIEVWSNFSKRKNSTKQPSTAGTILDVKLKNDVSIENPVFILQGSNFDYNYVKALGHYYFVDDITSIANNLIEISCTQDLLATYKSSILSYEGFVTRAQSEYKTMLPDNNIVIYNQETQTVANLSAGFVVDGCYIISVLNNQGSGAGFTCYYAVTISEMKEIAYYCNQNFGDTESITEIVQWIQATFLKTADAVVDCKWLPLPISIFQGSSTTPHVPIKVGKDFIENSSGMAVYGYRFDRPFLYTTFVDYTIGGIYSDFRKGYPYTKAFLYIPFYGMYQFNPIDFNAGLGIRITIDCSTGDTTIFLTNGGNISNTVSTVNYNLSVTAPVGKVGNDVGGAISSTLGAIGGGATALLSTSVPTAVVAGIGATASAINAVSAGASISPSVKGNMSGRSMSDKLQFQILLINSTTSNPDDLLNVCGRPLMAKRTLGSLSGYVQCAEASVNLACLCNDKDVINGLLNSGIFIE